MSKQSNSTTPKTVPAALSSPSATISSSKISPSLSSEGVTPVRRSTRDIKRKKFDDEVFQIGISHKTSRKQRSSVSEAKSEKAETMTTTTASSETAPALTSGSGGEDHRAPPAESQASAAAAAAAAAASTPQQTTAMPNIMVPTISPLAVIPPQQSSAASTTTTPSSPVVLPLTSPVVVHQLSPQQSPNQAAQPQPQTQTGAAAATKGKKGGRGGGGGRKKPPAAPGASGSAGSVPAQSAAGPTNAQLQEQAAALKDVGRWQPVDDLALITAVMQTSDLKAVYTGVKFSCKFTLQEVCERWYALLYDPLISKLAQEAMRQLQPDVCLSIQSNTLFSKNEERLLSSISSNGNPGLEVFNDLLLKHRDGFHPARTARSLYQHWLQMKQYRLLPDQKPLTLPQGDYVMNFSDLEENFVEADVQPTDPLTERELILAERNLTKQIRHLENELPKWHVLVECATGVATPDFDNNTVAVLRGRLVRYLMRSKEVSMGRSARGYQVDIDLSLEGPAFKVSRKQATIKLRATGDFYMINEGKRPMYIDGKPLLPGSKGKLNNNAVVELSCLRLLFIINQQLINSMREEAKKMAASTTTSANSTTTANTTT